jgi:hypothetical protein
MWHYLSLAPTVLVAAAANPEMRLKTSKQPLSTSSTKC